jgi:hypothetical protein
LQTLLDAGETDFAAYHTARRILAMQTEYGSKGNSYFDLMNCITGFVTSREALDALTKYLLSAYADLLRMKHVDTDELFFFTAEEAEGYTLHLSEHAILRSLTAVDGIRADAQYNTSVALSGALLAINLRNAISGEG